MVSIKTSICQSFLLQCPVRCSLYTVYYDNLRYCSFHAQISFWVFFISPMSNFSNIWNNDFYHLCLLVLKSVLEPYLCFHWFFSLLWAIFSNFLTFLGSLKILCHTVWILPLSNATCFCCCYWSSYKHTKLCSGTQFSCLDLWLLDLFRSCSPAFSGRIRTLSRALRSPHRTGDWTQGFQTELPLQLLLIFHSETRSH